MYNDYFYKEEPKPLDIFPGVNYQQQQIKYIKKPNAQTNPVKRRPKKRLDKKPVVRNSKRLLQARQEPDGRITKQFSNSNRHLKSISTGCQGILKSMEMIRNFVLIFGVAIFALNKYLTQKEKGFSSEYAPEGGYSGQSSGHISEKGLRLIMNQEGGFQSHAYLVKGEKYYTIGYGDHGPHVHAGDVITEPEARQRLLKKVHASEVDVNKHVKVPISQNMFDALVSLSYNLAGGIRKAETLLKKLNARDYKGAAEAFKLYNKGTEGGKTVVYKGLTRRRAEEAALFSLDITDDNKLKVAEVIGHTSSGNINRLQNGMTVGGYKMYNPNSQRKYIDLSDRAAAYLKESGGKGLVTSGAEGKHGEGKQISHKLGNKLDVVAIDKTDSGWADLAIPFIQNKNTAYINFEDFSTARFNKIKEIIYNRRPDLKSKCDGTSQYSFDRSKRFMFNYYTGGGLHLDIGIMPDAYSKYSYKEEEAQKAKKLKEQQKKLKEQEKQKKNQNKSNTNTSNNKSTKSVNNRVINAPASKSKNTTTYKDTHEVSNAQNRYNNEQAKIKKGK